MSRALFLAAWALVAATFVGIESTSLATRRRVPGLVETLRALTRGTAGRLVLFLGWMWLGWHIFAR